MSKRILKISLITFLFIIVLCIYNVVNANEIDSVNIVIEITEDGIAHVQEEWQATLDEGSELKHSFNNLGKSQIINFKVKDEHDNEFTLDNNWNSNLDLESKKNKCGMKTTASGVDLFWGIGEYASNAYFLEYDITNFVVDLPDGNQMINFEFFQKNREEIRHVGINILSSEILFKDIAEVWGYGYDNGLCQINAIGEIYFSSLGKLEPQESVQIIARFDSGSFPNVTTKLDHNFDFYYREIFGGEDILVGNKKVVLLVLISIFTGLIIFIILLAISNGKKPNKK